MPTPVDHASWLRPPSVSRPSRVDPASSDRDTRPEARLDATVLEGRSIDAGRRPALFQPRDEGLRLVTPACTVALPAGAVVACDGRELSRLHAPPGSSVALLCLWTGAVASGRSGGARQRLLPMLHEPDSPVARVLLDVGVAPGTAAPQAGDAAERVLHHVLLAQQCYQDTIDRCPGRCEARRRELFVWLCRARVVLGEGGIDGGNLQRIADLAHLSRSHFVRLFHQAFGEPPHAFRKRRRMERAMQLVRDTDLPIQEVMWRVGYDNHSGFARVFRQHHGISASALRAGQPRAPDRAGSRATSARPSRKSGF